MFSNECTRCMNKDCNCYTESDPFGIIDNEPVTKRTYVIKLYNPTTKQEEFVLQTTDVEFAIDVVEKLKKDHKGDGLVYRTYVKLPFSN